MLNHPAALQTKGKYLIYAKSLVRICDLVVFFIQVVQKQIWKY